MINETATGDQAVAITGTATSGEETIGVVGAGDAVGVRGDGKTWHGVVGISQSTIGGAGVFGANEKGAGVRGESSEKFNPGVHGIHKGEAGYGVLGDADNGAGIVGKSKTWHGVYGESRSTSGGAGVCGKGGMAGLFEGDVAITGNLTIQGVSIQIWLQRIVRLEQEVVSLRHQLGSHTHPGGGGSGSATPQAIATIHVEIDLSGFSQTSATRRVSGGGFNPGQVLVINTSSAGGTEQSSASTRADGTYSQELSVPKSNPPKQYLVWAEGSSSRRVSSKAGYSI